MAMAWGSLGVVYGDLGEGLAPLPHDIRIQSFISVMTRSKPYTSRVCDWICVGSPS